MKQRVTRELFGYWNALRGARAAPDRAELDAGAIRACLADTFVLTLDPVRGHPFRIAGTAVCAMFGRELTRTPFIRLWSTGDRERVADAVGALAKNTQPLVADITAGNALGEETGLEMILLPLTCADGAGRILGAFTAVAAPYWLGTRQLQALRLGEVQHAERGRLAEAGPGTLPARFAGAGFSTK
jgi:hypothetical protein